MKKINLFNEIIKVNKNELINAINSQKVFAININGKIVNESYDEKEIIIYEGKPKICDKFSTILGKNYQIVDDNDTFLIKAFSNWQEIIDLNTKRASYDDTTADGVAEFSNKKLEEIGWHATEFNIDYRTLVEYLEENCDGKLICIEQEDPYKFSGLGFIKDDIEAKNLMYVFCQKIIKDKISNDKEFAADNLTDDEEEAAHFFKAI